MKKMIKLGVLVALIAFFAVQAYVAYAICLCDWNASSQCYRKCIEKGEALCEDGGGLLYVDVVYDDCHCIKYIDMGCKLDSPCNMRCYCPGASMPNCEENQL